LPHRYRGAPAGLGLPHSVQKFPVFTAPQEQVQLEAAGAAFGFSAGDPGLGLPHSVQNFPVFTAPQEQVQLAAAWAAGSFRPI
jgi:hypothetical protein